MSKVGESREESNGSTPASAPAADGAALDYKGKRLEYWTKILGAITAALVVLSTALGIGLALLNNKSASQSEDIDTLRGTIDSLQRTNGDQADQVRTLEKEAQDLRAQRDDALRERDATRDELAAANAKLAQAGVGSASTSSTSPTDAGGDVRSFTLPWSNRYGGTTFDLDAGAVRDSGVDLRYQNQEGQRAVVSDYGQAISTNIGVQSPNRAQCKEAVDRRPLAQDDFWASPAMSQQACVVSHFGISLLTVQGVAENGDLSLTQIYWRSD